MQKVAIFIGKVSGIGLAVARALCEREWMVHIISRGAHNIKRLDFVFGSVIPDGKAGVADNLTVVVRTAVLALKYGQHNPDGQECSVVLNANGASFCAAESILDPGLDTAAINFVRYISKSWAKQNVRVNVICPALVPDGIPPMAKVVQVVLGLVTGELMKDSRKAAGIDETLHGLAVEISGEKIHFRDAQGRTCFPMAH
ncbi:hypothetical protein PG993_010790 [Apiospora rasikravindrae]|uniref:Uncharacterized protein n=1 Tax=Apiospora rasikravindrae TaxID=990691 RepID=A0ABR1SCE6_9PEZI